MFMRQAWLPPSSLGDGGEGRLCGHPSSFAQPTSHIRGLAEL